MASREKKETFADWEDIFPAARALVPARDDPEFKLAATGVVRGLFIDLSDLAPVVAARKTPTAPLQIHADVLRLCGPVILRVSALTLHARRIEVAPGAILILDAGDDEEPPATCDLTVCALELAGDAGGLQVDFLGVRQTVAIDASGGGLQARWSQADRTVVCRKVPAMSGDPLLGAMQLLTAKRLLHSPSDTRGFDTHELATQMVLWLRLCHARPGGDPSLLAQSETFLNSTALVLRGVHVVPALRAEQYTRLGDSAADALDAVDREYDKFFDRAADADEREKAARQMLAHFETAQKYTAKLLEQSEAEMLDAQQANARSSDKMDQQLARLDEARADFDEGIAKKKKEMEREAAFAIAGAVLAIGAGVAIACTGNPAGAAVAAGAATGAAEKTAEAAKQISRLQKLLQKIAKAIEAIKKLKAAVETLTKLFEAIRQHQDTTKLLEELAQTFHERADPDEAMTTADWDAFVVDTRALFVMPEELGIEGATEYRKTLEILAIRGKDVIDTGFYFHTCANDYQRRLWECERDRADAQRAAEELDAREGTSAPGAHMMAIYERMRDELKITLVQAMEKIGGAYRYYTLVEPPPVPSMLESTAVLRKSLVDTRASLVQARENLPSAPSRWGPQRYKVWAGDALNRLRSHRAFSWRISTNNFLGYERIRLSELRVWLIGVAGKGEIYVKIATTGTYQDRGNGQLQEFVSAPWRRTFAYRQVDFGETRDHRGNQVEITARADDADDAFFQPTPFTTWEISIPAELNKSLDLAGLEEVGLEFYGTFVGTARSAPRALAASAPEVDKDLLEEVLDVD